MEGEFKKIMNEIVNEFYIFCRKTRKWGLHNLKTTRWSFSEWK